MIKIIKKVIENRRVKTTQKARKDLIKKVERGTDFVIHEYGEALRKLGAYDRQ